MRVSLVALLLFATAAHGQWVSPAEQSYGPYLAPPAGADAAVVASNGAVLLAWSEVDSLTGIAGIRAGILDFDGRLSSPVMSVPTYQAGAEAYGPTVASDGEGFAVAWLENQPRRRIATIALKADGTPASAPLLVNTFTSAERAPSIHWVGNAYFVYGLTFDRDGQLTSPPSLVPAHLRYASGDTLVGVKWESHRDEWRYVIGSHTAVFFPAEFKIEWQFTRDLRTVSEGSKAFSYYAPEPVVAGNGDEVAIAWGAPDGISGVRPAETTLRPFRVTPSVGSVPEDIAFDGDVWLVVFTRDRDVWGALVHRTDRTTEPFPISTTDRRESRVHVTALRPGRFLVWYSSDGPDGHRFAGRIVLVNAPKKSRVVRP